MNAEKTVENTIRERKLIDPGDRVLLGLSGGPDSLCLLYVLSDLKEEFGFSLEALHLNHLMRGEAAEDDVRFLKEECEKLGVPLTVICCDVPEKARRERICEEEAGRAARHEALKKRAAEMTEGGYSVKTAFAHNRNDQAETVLLRVLRGTGVHGLAAMEFKRADGVIRPLLETPRADIEDYCEARGLKPRFDSTNKSDDYTRNRLRHHLLPQLEEEYNPNIKEGLFRLSQSAGDDDELLRQLAENAFSDCEKASEKEGCVTFSSEKLSKLHPALLKRVLSLGFLRLGLEKDIASTHLNSLCKAIYERRFGAKIQFPAGYMALVYSKRGVILGFDKSAFTKQKKNTSE